MQALFSLPCKSEVMHMTKPKNYVNMFLEIVIERYKCVYVRLHLFDTLMSLSLDYEVQTSAKNTCCCTVTSWDIRLCLV